MGSKATSGIYQIQSKSYPSRIYIGSSVDIKSRWYVHKNRLKKNNHHSCFLQNHYNTYGFDDLSFTIIEECSHTLLLEREQYYIDSLNPCFNMAKEQVGTTRGIKQSEEHKKKISEKLSGVPFTQEHKDNIGKRVYQFTLEGEFVREYPTASHAAEYGFKRGCVNHTANGGSSQNKGYIFSYEPFLSQERIERVRNRPNKRKRVVQMTLTGDVIKIWDGIRSVDHSGFSSTIVIACCKKRSFHHRGFLWMYEGDDSRDVVDRYAMFNRVVYQYTMDGVFVKKWDNSHQTIANGFRHSLVWSCCDKNKGAHKGYIWRFERDVLNGTVSL